jgi:hypothetical protein
LDKLLKNEEWKMKSNKINKTIKFIKLIYLREYYLTLNW